MTAYLLEVCFWMCKGGHTGYSGTVVTPALVSVDNSIHSKGAWSKAWQNKAQMESALSVLLPGGCHCFRFSLPDSVMHLHMARAFPFLAGVGVVAA